MKTYYKVTCELYTEHVVPVLNAKQYDSGRGVDITLTDCGAVVVPAVSDVCNLYCKKSDGTVSYISGTVTGDAVRVDFTNTLLAAPGIIECELEVTSGADTVSTPVFRMVVLPSNYDQGAIQSQDEFTALEDALAQLSNIGPAAAYDVADNLTTAAAGSYVLDAAQGKALNDSITALDGSAVKLFTGADGVWLGYISSSNTIGFYKAAYPSGANLLGVAYLDVNARGAADGTEMALTSGTWATLGSITHGVGTYLLIMFVYFDTNATGVRLLHVNESDTSDAAMGSIYQEHVPAVNGQRTTLRLVATINATASGSWYAHGYQNSGSSLNAKVFMQTIKLR